MSELTIHEQLQEAAFEERNREAAGIVNFLQDKIRSLRAFEREFVQDLDPEKVYAGQLSWAEQMARRLGYTNV